MQKLLGFDIGGTKCAVLIANYDGVSLDILSKETIATDKNEAPDSILKRLCSIADKNLNNENVDFVLEFKE